MSQFIRLGSNLILAWLLTPDAFGMAALSFTLFYGLVLMSDVGAGAMIIRSKRAHDPVFYNTVWTFQIAQGLFLFVVCLMLAEPFAEFYGQPDLYYMVILGGTGLFVQGLRSTWWVGLQRDMRIKKLTLYEFVAQVLGVSSTIAYAVISPEAVAMVVGFCVTVSVTTLISHVAHGEEIKNRLCWNRVSFSEIFNFGKWVFVSSTFSFLAQKSDRLVLGKLSSVEMLGVYHVAMMLAELPRFIIQMASAKLLYPMFSHFARENVDELRTNFFKVRNVILPVMLLLCLAIVFLADPFFFYFYKDSFHQAMWIAPCLVLMLWFEILIGTVDRVLLALGDSKILANVWILIFPIKLVGACLGYYYFDLIGFIGGLAVGSIVGYIRLALAAKKIGFNVLHQDFKYTLLLLALTMGYFSLKWWLGVHSNEVSLWLSGLCFATLGLCGGKIIFSRIKNLAQKE